jgi:hypothetical protein
MPGERKVNVIRHQALVVVGLVGSLAVAVRGAPQASSPAAGEDAAALYLRAAGSGFEVQSPANSTLEYEDYPPYPPEWHQLAKAAREANRERLKLARVARTGAAPARWPSGDDQRYLTPIRQLANELADAALYEQTQGNDVEAVELARDALALGHSIRGSKNFIVNLLVGGGAEGLGCHRLMLLGPQLRLGKDPAANRKVLPPELIADLLAPRDVKAEFAAALAREKPLPPGAKPLDVGQVTEVLTRCYAEQGLTAMSLACQLYRAEKGRWPATAAELVPAYLPKLLPDPFGDGKQTLGYVLIKGGLPDGGDRPLVYHRNNSPDGLLYRIDEPQFGFYKGDGSTLPAAQQKHGGQFRDVTLWKPVKLAPGASTTRVLEPPKASTLPF